MGYPCPCWPLRFFATLLVTALEGDSLLLEVGRQTPLSPQPSKGGRQPPHKLLGTKSQVSSLRPKVGTSLVPGSVFDPSPLAVRTHFLPSPSCVCTPLLKSWDSGKPEPRSKGNSQQPLEGSLCLPGSPAHCALRSQACCQDAGRAPLVHGPHSAGVGSLGVRPDPHPFPTAH